MIIALLILQRLSTIVNSFCKQLNKSTKTSFLASKLKYQESPINPMILKYPYECSTARGEYWQDYEFIFASAFIAISVLDPNRSRSF
jgi:hypothetical protein